MPQPDAIQARSGQPFLKRHKRWLSFLGTVVVLGTFVVNEALRNTSRELADSVDRARYAFIQRSETQAIEKEVRDANSAIDALRSKFQKPTVPPEPIKTGEFGMDIETAVVQRPDLVSRQAHLDNVLSLYEKLPYDRNLDDQHWKLVKKTALLRQLFDDLAQLDFDIDTQKQQEAEMAKIRIRREREQLRISNTDHGAFFDDAIQTFEGLVVDSAEDIRKSAEARSTRWKHVSYGLYPLGLLLGLLGKVWR